MRKLVTWVMASGIVIGAAMNVGCGSQTTEPPSTSRPVAADLKDGLTVISANPDVGVSAAFKANGRAIFLETRVGPLKPEVYRREFPDEPQFEMDARFVDHEGRTFKVQIGGDTLIDPTWNADIMKGRALAPPTAEQRKQDFQLASDAAAAFRAAGSPELMPHLYHLSNLGNSVPTEAMQKKALALQTTERAPAAVGDVGYDSSCYYNWFETDLYAKCIFLCVAHHSATIGWNYSNCTSSWDEQKVACNHGTCANDSSMGYQCYTNADSGWVGGNVDIYSLTFETTTSNQQTTAGCSTGYNWNTPPGHECNDDSHYELFQTKAASTSTGYGDNWSFNHTDTNGNNYGCSCGSYGASCSGDWSTPACN